MRKLKLGLIGCGRVVERFHLPALQDNDTWKLAAAADPDPERRAWIAGQVPDILTFADVDQLLHTIELDAALIAAPPRAQAELATLALAAGLHVLLEKPGVSSLPEAERLSNAASDSEGSLRLGFNRRFMANYRRLRQGLPASVEIGGLRGQYLLQTDQRAWASFSAYLGVDAVEALLLDLVPHQLDALSWLVPDTIKGVRRLAPALGPDQIVLSFEVAFEGGARIQCRAGHTDSYQERLWLKWPGGNAGLYPTGTVFGLLAAEPLRESTLAALSWLDRKLIRLGLKPDVMAGGFRDQWRRFADELVGKVDGSRFPGPEALVRLHAWIQDLRQPDSGSTAAPNSK